MIFRKAELRDLDQIVDIHMLAFPDFFLTSLGKSFLKQYYKVYIKYSHIALVAEDNEVIEGFVVGSNNSVIFYENLKKEFIFFIYPTLLNAINLKLLSKIFKRLFSVLFKKKVNRALKTYTGLNELTSIGVNPKGQSRGLGRKLLIEYEQQCRAYKVKGITLTTDAENNDGVLTFYKKSGYEIDQTFIQDEKRVMYSLVKYF